jgi:hypothetical protein
MRGLGRAVFVAILLLIAGILNITYGIGAIADANFWVGENHFVLGNLHTWGWVTLIVGVIEVFAGLSLFAGGTFGRTIGIVAASLGAIASLLAVGGAYPFWALGVFAICVICIHGLVVYGEPLEEENRLPGSNDRRAGAPRDTVATPRG